MAGAGPPYCAFEPILVGLRRYAVWSHPTTGFDSVRLIAAEKRRYNSPMASNCKLYLNSAGRALPELAQAVLNDLRGIGGSRGRRVLGNKLRYREGNPWIFVEDDARSFGLELSKIYGTEAVSLTAVASLGACSYTHFAGGEVRRELFYCGEGKGWERVIGEPEAWESEFLFANQAGDLAVLQERLAQASYSKEQQSFQREIEAMTHRRIVARNLWPRFRAEAVGRAYALPGFGPESLQPRVMETWWTFTEIV